MSDQEFLKSRGWVEADKVGPWRWYRPEWLPISYYTLKDAFSLEVAMGRMPRTGHGD